MDWVAFGRCLTNRERVQIGRCFLLFIACKALLFVGGITTFPNAKPILHYFCLQRFLFPVRSVPCSDFAEGEDDAVHTQEEQIDADNKADRQKRDDGAKAGKP